MQLAPTVSIVDKKDAGQKPLYGNKLAIYSENKASISAIPCVMTHKGSYFENP
jgi:hypothetical protein